LIHFYKRTSPFLHIDVDKSMVKIRYQIIYIFEKITSYDRTQKPSLS